jgi:hypothetical protein
MARSLAQASERAHMSHPDFRVGGKIFATLGYPDERFGMVVLTPEDQAKFTRAHPKVFAPAAGAWGRRGSTSVRLDEIDEATLGEALAAAWQRRAPKRLLKTRGPTSDDSPS